MEGLMIKFIVKKLLGALIGAPWWAYILLIYLLWIGFQATKPRAIWLPKLFIGPVIFIGLFLVNIFRTYGADPTALGLYLVAILVGITIGWLLVRHTIVVADKAKNSINLPGSYVPLMLFLAIFVFKYCEGYISAVHPELSQTPVNWLVFKVIAPGIIAGLMLGRNLGYLDKYFKS
jgi:hypothetical protein